MPRVKRLRKDNPYYLIPIMMGMAGVLFSSQLEDPLLQGTVVLLSVGVPLFIGGNLFSRIHSVGLQRYLLIAGMIMLTIGAVVTISGYSESLVAREMVSERLGELSRTLGMGSLLLGLLVVLYSMLRSEAVINELGERFRHLAEQMSEGFVLIDAQGDIVMANRRLAEMTGVSIDSLIGMNARKAARQLNIEPMAVENEKRAKGVASEYQVTWPKDGEEIQLWVSGTPLYDHRGRQIGTLATMRDITEQHRLAKRLEMYTQGLQQLVEDRTQKLRESETRFRELLLHMNEGFLTIDADDKVRFANERICELLKISKDSLLDRNIFDFVDSSGRTALRTALDAAGLSAAPRADSEFALLRDDGAALPVKISIAPIHNAAEDEQQYSLVLTDVHELKDMQYQLELRARELEEVNKELRELDRAKDTFLSNVSHELRTPLSTLQGYIEMLEAGSLGAAEGPQAGALKVMARNAERLSMMINEMIEFSRMEIRGVRLRETLCDLAALLDECVDSAHPQALKKDLSVSLYVPDDMPGVWADREKLSQVVSILLSNAVKFSQEGAMIQIRAARKGEADLTIDVIDTGIGIDPVNHERVFRKFFQVDGSLTRHYQGTGIGLSIAKNIVMAHGGSISVTSQLKKGSTFTIELPGALFVDADGAQPETNVDGRHVLVTTNMNEFRESIAAVLEGHGFEVETFASGFDCARRAAETQPDAVLMDEVSSDLSETDLSAAFREKDATRDVPIVLFRDADGGDSLHNAHLLSGVYVLRKPFSVKQLFDAIAAAEQAAASDVPAAPGDAL